MKSHCSFFTCVLLASHSVCSQIYLVKGKLKNLDKRRVHFIAQDSQLFQVYTLKLLEFAQYLLEVKRRGEGRRESKQCWLVRVVANKLYGVRSQLQNVRRQLKELEGLVCYKLLQTCINRDYVLHECIFQCNNTLPYFFSLFLSTLLMINVASILH